MHAYVAPHRVAPPAYPPPVQQQHFNSDGRGGGGPVYPAHVQQQHFGQYPANAVSPADCAPRIQQSADTFPGSAQNVSNTAECLGPEGRALQMKLENMEAILANHPGSHEEKEPLRMRLQALRSSFENMRAQYGMRLSEARARNRIAHARLEAVTAELVKKDGPQSSGLASSGSSDRMRTPSPEWTPSTPAAPLFSPSVQMAGRGVYIDATP
jgi:hypothetical protein